MARAEGIVFCPAAAGQEIADEIAALLQTVVITPDNHRGLPSGSCFSSEMQNAFAAGIPVIGVCAAGILIRILAPLIRDKTSEPPVLCVAPDGSAVVPLLGGHRGAVALARRIARLPGTRAAITTASEAALGVALDDPPPGWRLENPECVKQTAAALLAGRPTCVSGQADWLKPLESLANVSWTGPCGPDDPAIIRAQGAEPLVVRAQNLALGVGSIRGCDPDALTALVHSSLAEAGMSASAIAGVYSIDIKADETAIHELAENLGVPARFFSARTLRDETDRLSAPSDEVFREVGVFGVCEAAALAAAGPAGELVLTKQKSGAATCALARIGPGAGNTGKPRGRLMIIGIGPGDPGWRSLEAVRMIAEADEIVGYGGYLKLLGPLGRAKPSHAFELGQEEERCRFALERAGAGLSVALISSGDAGVYAMASPVMELLSRGDAEGGVSAAARRAAVVCAPGISAMQAASARAGAVLGHDFCAVSLSDLLTPREVILRRVSAAAEADFVIGFYNPASDRRRTLLAEARDILLRHRSPETPVLIARQVGRKGESVVQLPLSSRWTEDVDMMTMVIVGSESTRAFQSGDSRAGAAGWRLYTPRGYADPRNPPS